MQEFLENMCVKFTVLTFAAFFGVFFTPRNKSYIIFQHHNFVTDAQSHKLLLPAYINCLSSRYAISHTCLRQHNIITRLISIYPSSNQSHSDAKQLDHPRYVCRSRFSALLFQHIFGIFLIKSYFTSIFLIMCFEARRALLCRYDDMTNYFYVNFDDS